MLDPDQVALQFFSQWQAAINDRQPERMAELFANDAIFVATAPAPLVGRSRIVEYYRATPVGLEVSVALKVAKSAAPTDVRAVGEVVFILPDGNYLSGRLTLTFIMESPGAWRVSLYHAALQSAPKPG
jgi:uncharacterized protein (TIGR02246 family)